LTLLSSPLWQREWDRYFSVIFKEAVQEELLQISLVLDRACRKLHEPFKGNSLEGADIQMGQNGIV